jgi:hypothetical protein
MAYSQNNIGWNQVNKKVTKATRKIAKTVDEYVMPKSATDVAMFLFPYGKVAKGVVKGAKKVIKPAAKVKKVVPTKSPAKTAKKLVKNIKKTKPLEDVPTGVSNRYQATLQRLAAEEAKKKKK